MNRGRLIVFEGIDGAGKSSHLQATQLQLQAAGIDPVMTREPGGTALGEQLRELLLHEPMAPATECLLMFAARQQHLSEVILPALQRGRWVICDRFTDATYAYQGHGRGFSLEKIARLEAWVQGDTLPNFQPDHTLLFDLPPQEAATRRQIARNADKFEQLDLEFFTRVREGYRQQIAKRPEAYSVVDSRPAQAEVAECVRQVIADLIRRFS